MRIYRDVYTTVINRSFSFIHPRQFDDANVSSQRRWNTVLPHSPRIRRNEVSVGVNNAEDEKLAICEASARRE